MDPFDSEPIPEVPLTRSPLKVALFQASFHAPLSAFTIPSKIQEMQAAFEPVFPYLESQSQQSVHIAFQSGQVPPPSMPEVTQVHLFSSADQQWRFTVMPDSIALATTAYFSRADFVERARRTLEVVASVATVPVLARLGVRYINRIEGLDAIDRVLSGANDAVSSVRDVVRQSSGEIQHLMTDLAFAPETARADAGTRIQSRWGQLPPGVVHEGLLAPVNLPTWVLDIDAVREGQLPFGPLQTAADIEDLSERSYKVFRWIMQEDALKELGAR